MNKLIPFKIWVSAFILTLFGLTPNSFINAQYCNSNYTSVAFEYITNVNFAGINNSSAGNTGGPVNYTGQVANVTAGTSVPMSVTIVADANDYVYAFFDWNQNNVLNDPGEVYTLATLTNSPGPHTLNINVPVTALAGNTRMRVMLAWNDGSANPCASGTWGEVEDYTVNVSTAPCAAPANGGTATAAVSSVCPGVNFGINTTGVSFGSGTVYQWQSSPDGFTWNNVAGQNSASFNGSQTQALSYRLQVICTNGPDTAYSNAVQVNVTPFLNCYCTSGATATTYGHIKRVQLNTIDNTSPSGCGQQYTDFTSIQTNLIEGLTYPLSLSLENCSFGTYNYGTRVWIDFNQNGLFDATELVYDGYPSVTAGQTTVVNANLTVPSGVSYGLTRMRIVTVETTPGPAACGTYTWGETEDYYVNVLPPPANEAGVLAITKPEIAACTLGQQVWVELQNLGTDTLTSADFQVTVSGFALPVANWTGAVPPQSTQEVQIPITYVLADGDSVAVTVSNPNGVVEDPLFAFNNFFSRRVWAGLSGVKTVYGGGADFADVDAAIDALEFRGVCDTVFFQIATGAYTTQHTMVSYPGAGPGKLAVFESASGNAADVSFTRAGTSAADNFVFNFNNADGYMIRNLTAVNPATAFSTVISFNAGSDNNILEDNVFIGDTSAVYNLGDFNGVVIASINASNDNGTVIRNNHIMGGNRGINLGGATGSYETGAVVEGNLIEKYAVIGGIFGNLSGYTVKNNIFRPRTNLTQEVFGVYAVGTIAGADISGNDYQSYRPGSGIFLSNVKGGANEVQVKNNFVFMGDSAGAVVSRGVLIQDVNTSGVLVANNSISFHSDNATSGAITVVDGSEIRFFNNNVGAFGTAPVVRIEKPYSVSASDNNNLFGSTVANLVGSSYATLAAFQAASSTNAASLSVNPGFNGTDLHTCTPELNGAALVLAEVTVDFDGDPRSTMPDIGADEFVGDANYIRKQPQTGEVPLHQNWAFADERKCCTVSIWCPLVDSTVENGTLQVVPGSHKRFGEIRGPMVPWELENIKQEIIEKYLVPLETKAGDCVILDDSIVHYSALNHTGGLRLAIQLICIPAEFDSWHYFMNPSESTTKVDVLKADVDFYMQFNPWKIPENPQKINTIQFAPKYISEAEFSKRLKGPRYDMESPKGLFSKIKNLLTAQ